MFYLLLSFLLTFILTPLIRHVMQRYGIVDRPKTAERKIHKRVTPLGGGLVLWLSFFLVLALAIALGDIGTDVQVSLLVGAFLGSLCLMIGGLLDDKYHLGPKKQILAPAAAAIITILFGLGIESVTHPMGGMLALDQIKVPLFGLEQLLVFADALVFFWLMGMMYTTKLLDGLDGLVTGMVAIGAGLVFMVSQQDAWYQPEVGRVALIFMGACLGFLLWNKHPAKMFLGESGSLFAGYMLGVLALISGSKIATTILVMGIPILDVARVMVTRWYKKRPIFAGDSEHLHFRLLESGLNQRQTVYLFYALSALFGISTLFLQSHQKLIALSFLFILMCVVGVWFSKEH